MVIDTSVFIAILSAEPEAERFAALIDADTIRLTSAATYLETAIVIESRRGEEGGHQLDERIDAAKSVIMDVTKEQASIARLAYRTFGKGRHAASLNYGDCFSYALAVATRQPLLFQGDDFGKTDVQAVIEG